jgi:regulator of sigma E protease
MPTKFKEPPEPRSRFGRLSNWSWIFLVALVAALALERWSLLVAILGLALLIFVHELGHFLAAKAFGMRVEKFYIGFPPAAAKRRRSETEYGVGLIPLGGFCKISGMTPDEEVPEGTGERVYWKKPVWQRNVTIFAGPFMNFIAAVVILFVAFTVQGITTPSLTLEEVVPGAPAAEAGLQAGDTLIGADGQRWQEWDDALAFFGDNANEEVTLTWRPEGAPAGTTQSAQVTLEEHPQLPGQGYLGVRAGTQTESLMPWTAARMAVVGTYDIFRAFFGGIYMLVSGEVSATGDQGAVGPVGIIDLSQGAVQEGWYPILLVLLSINLGIINLLPLLPFDGGHILFNTIESIRGRRVDQRVQERTAGVGIVLLIMLALFLTFNDLQRMFG